MTLLDLVRAQASVGTRIAVTLVNGKEHRGRIVAVTSNAIVIEGANGHVAVDERLLGAWELLDGPDVPIGQPDTSVAGPSRRLEEEPTLDGARPLDPIVGVRLAEIRARYDQGAQQSAVRRPEVKFELPTHSGSTLSATAVKQTLDRIRNQYAYALKIGEPGRLIAAASQLRRLLTQEATLPGWRLLVGQLLISANQINDALDACAEEWRLFRTPDAALAAAYCALQANSLPKACRFLTAYLTTTPSAISGMEWFSWIGAVSRLRAYSLWPDVVGVLTKASSDAQAVRPTVAEGLVYCFLLNHRRADAAKLARAMVEENAGVDILMAAARDLAQSVGDVDPQWTRFLESERAATIALQIRERQDALAARLRQFEATPRLPPDGHVRWVSHDGLYGFIKDSTCDDRWFSMSDVTDASLGRELMEYRRDSQIPVSFQSYEHDGRPRARHVSYPATLGDALRNARDLQRQGKSSLAQGLVEAILNSFPGDRDAQSLHEELRRTGQPMQPAATPQGSSIYARALRAQNIDKDLGRAEALFREALRRGEHLDGVVKGLAMLLGQQDRKADAVKLIETYLPRLADKKPALNILATTLTHIKKYRESIVALEQIKALSGPGEVAGVLKRMAYSHYMLQDYSAAERVLASALESVPGDATALKLKASLAAARQSGVYTETDALFDLGVFTEVSYNVSPTLQFALERCDYAGVVASAVATRNFTQETLHSVRRLIDQQRARPRERAGYLLTYARLLQDLGSEDHAQFRSTLFAYSCAVGDTAASQRKPLDVTRAYYAEALFLEDTWHTIVNRVVQYLRSYVVKSEELLPIDGKSAPLDDTLSLVCGNGASPLQFWDGVLDICVINRTVAQNLLPRIWQHPAARDGAKAYLRSLEVSPASDSEAPFLQAWNEARQRRSRDFNDWFERVGALASTTLSAASCETVANDLDQLRPDWLPSIDVQRMIRASAIVTTARSVYLPIQFEERERSYQNCITQVETLLQDIESNPTRFAVGGIHPFLERVREQLRPTFEEVLANTSPRVTVDLALDQVTPDAHGRALLQLRVSNDRGGQPITGVTVSLANDAGDCWPVRDSFDYADVIRGDDSAIVECEVSFTPDAIRARAVSVTATVSYRNRKGDEVQAPPQKVSVRLYAAADFVEIVNPFAPYAEGGPVKNREMFYGRESDIDNIAAALGIAHSKCVVIYGQKRAGKSSVLYHLHARLNASDRVFAVALSLGSVVAEFSLAALFYRMAVRLTEAIDTVRRDGAAVPILADVAYSDFRENATVAFLEFLRQYRRAADAVPTWGARRLVFLIDEFTYLYTAIKTGRIAPDVMKTWKALLEDGQFSAVLVGQDVMPRFKAEFPNEFGVTQDIRLSYLPDRDCAQLLDLPIRIGGVDGESRYKGKALQRALELVSGSAYYGQMLGSRLVDYMNDVRATYVTEADIDKVSANMVSGPESLEKDKFDNLLTAGDAATDAYPQDAVLRTVAAIARNSRGGLCGKQVLAEEVTEDLDGILAELAWRGVVDEPQRGYFRVHVGMFQEWLLARWGTADGLGTSRYA